MYSAARCGRLLGHHRPRNQKNCLTHQTKNSMNQEEKNQFMWKVNSDTGRALADLRQHRGMTLKQVAAASDYEPENIAAAEAGKLPHNVHNLARIVEAMQGRLAIIPQESPDDPHCQFIELED